MIALQLVLPFQFILPLIAKCFILHQDSDFEEVLKDHGGLLWIIAALPGLQRLLAGGGSFFGLEPPNQFTLCPLCMAHSFLSYPSGLSLCL